MIYTYIVHGLARGGQAWLTKGTVSAERGQFKLALERALAATFASLTEGVAVQGRPAETCQGPFQITKFSLEEIDSSSHEPGCGVFLTPPQQCSCSPFSTSYRPLTY